MPCGPSAHIPCTSFPVPDELTTEMASQMPTLLAGNSETFVMCWALVVGVWGPRIQFFKFRRRCRRATDCAMVGIKAFVWKLIWSPLILTSLHFQNLHEESVVKTLFSVPKNLGRGNRLRSRQVSTLATVHQPIPHSVWAKDT